MLKSNPADDVCYGYLTGTDGWLQDPRPRPFYTSHAAIATAQLNQVRPLLENSANSYTIAKITDYEDKLHNKWGRFLNNDLQLALSWKFLHIPDSINVPYDRIYQPQLPCQ